VEELSDGAHLPVIIPRQQIRVVALTDVLSVEASTPRFGDVAKSFWIDGKPGVREMPGPGPAGRWFVDRLKQIPVETGKAPKPTVTRKKAGRSART
jgi:hypothetical protein